MQIRNSPPAVPLVDWCRTFSASLCVLLVVSSPLWSQSTAGLVLRGGWLFDGVADTVARNPGIVIRGGKITRLGAVSDGNVLQLRDDDYIMPGMFDLHAHYALDLFGAGRVDETVAYPTIFLANGVTSTFPAGEVDPDSMFALRRRIERGEQIGPRIFSSGPYFGAAREGWDPEITTKQIVAEVDEWARRGVRGFKAKAIGPEHLEALIRRAHAHGLPVTGHLGSGHNHSVNPRDAIRMGIDRVEHFLGGDALTADRPAYASLVAVDTNTAAFRRIVDLYLDHGVFFDATLTAFGYFGRRDPEVFAPFIDESRFLTPYMQSVLRARAPRPANEQFERIYWVKRRTIKAFYDAGGARLITLGTDHPSWGEFFSGFSVHRELHALVLSGIPPAAALKIATVNGARALDAASYLGTVEPGKLADLVVLSGNPLEDIRSTRNVRLVIKDGNVFSAPALLQSVERTIGPDRQADEWRWGRSRRARAQ